MTQEVVCEDKSKGQTATWDMLIYRILRPCVVKFLNTIASVEADPQASVRDVSSPLCQTQRDSPAHYLIIFPRIRICAYDLLNFCHTCPADGAEHVPS